MENVEAIMSALAAQGITVILKIDHERVSDGTEPWTIVMSGPGVGEGEFIRVDASSLAACVEQGVSYLREKPGDWHWLTSLMP
ncbi:hypothetical protein [Streptomyces sp. URMC 129]|uniref:hypothetical protein n=1 Tax=Streptomyces sp. URMC 129 TaxID=3423407 RepID=UPI003F197549